MENKQNVSLKLNVPLKLIILMTLKNVNTITVGMAFLQYPNEVR